MFDAPPPMQRSNGLARVGLSHGRLTALHQQGSAKAMLRLPPRSAGAEVVFLNTSGGLTAGDRLDLSLTLTGGEATATTQTAERAYRADGAPAQVDVTLTAHDASLNWLPQETILFDGARLDRRTDITLTGGARFLGLETVILGRAAMGEVVTRLHLTDRRTVRREGRVIHLDPLRLDDAALTRAQGPALLQGARALATLTLIEAGAADALPAVRAALTQPGVTADASALDGRLVLRALAADGWPLRRQMIRLIELLRPGALPRVWQI